MNHAIELRLRAAEGALVRALGLAERRGFQLESVNVEKDSESQRLRLVVSSPTRSIDVLQRQLERLHDVIDVVIASDRPASFKQVVVGG